jgi:hypothetical protein
MFIATIYGLVVKDFGDAIPPGRSFGCGSIYVGREGSVPN